jgi:hypothetical protein
MRSVLIGLVFFFTHLAQAGDGKLLGTGGLLSIEGSAGGGITPWAVLAGYGEREQFGASAAVAQTATSDFRLRSAAGAIAWHNRVELSVARQHLQLPATLGAGALAQNIYGAKVRLAGDLIYGELPQFSVGLQYKDNTSKPLLQTLGIADNRDLDYYLSVSKLFLAGPFDRSWLLNGSIRSSKALQTGLLGFSQDRTLQFEGSVATLLNRHWIVGTEYRGKPNGPAGLREDAWQDLFIAWLPNKNLSLALAYVDLGDVAGQRDQNGYFFTVQGVF